jgi:Ran GTPase-activating protein (RanGAP) involved in mRNA processing and transport
MKFSALQLRDTNLSVQGLSYLLQNIDKAQSIQQLDLSENQAVSTKQGIHMLVDYLEASSHIVSLTLQNCGLHKHPIKVLARSLHNHKTIKTVDLSHNRDINDKAGQSLYTLLKKNQQVTKLVLVGCKRLSKEIQGVINDGLRYNNSFLKTIGFSSEFSLAILDSVHYIEQLTKPVK